MMGLQMLADQLELVIGFGNSGARGVSDLGIGRLPC